MSTMSSHRKLFIALFLFSLSFLGGLLFVVIPLMGGISKDAQTLRLHQEVLETFQKESEELKNFQAFSKEREKDLQGLDNLFVSPETPIPFIEFLEERAESLGMEFAIVPAEPTQVKEDRWPSLEFRISSASPYPAAFAFLKAIENAPFVLEIQSVTLDAKRHQGTSQTLPASGDVESLFIVKVYTK